MFGITFDGDGKVLKLLDLMLNNTYYWITQKFVTGNSDEHTRDDGLNLPIIYVFAAVIQYKT